jgi:hypothetical protein
VYPERTGFFHTGTDIMISKRSVQASGEKKDFLRMHTSSLAMPMPEHQR